jgi:hypothetical protein
MRRELLHTVAASVATLALALGLTACGDDGGGDGNAPSASDIPAGAVAVVGEQRISKSQIDRRVTVLARAQSGRKGQARVPREQLRHQAMSTLIQQTAYEQEAKERGIAVTDAEVRKRFAPARRRFKSKAAFRRFLGGSSKADLLAQLRLQLLAERIGEDVRNDGGNPKDFMKDFQKRWTDRTVCAERYATSGCANASRDS